MTVTAAVMLVKDEADIIEQNVRYLLSQLDAVFVSDNGSTDGTLELLREIEHDDGRLNVSEDPDPAYYQSAKTTALAMHAYDEGFKWVVPVDADEFWYANDGRTIARLLGGLAPDVQFVTAPLYHHIPTAADPPAECPSCASTGEVLLAGNDTANALRRGPEGSYITCPQCMGDVEPNPFRRIGFRKRESGVLGKVACRLRPDLIIHAGNHSASTEGTGLSSSGFTIRHFSWRSADQYLKKIRNGEAAYKLTDLPADTGRHWRMWEDKTDEAIMDSFRHDFWSPDPHRDSTLMFDPAPGA